MSPEFEYLIKECMQDYNVFRDVDSKDISDLKKVLGDGDDFFIGETEIIEALYNIVNKFAIHKYFLRRIDKMESELNQAKNKINKFDETLKKKLDLNDQCARMIVNEKDRLKLQVETLSAEVERLNKIIQSYNKHYLQKAKVMNGEKIALKHPNIEEAIRLHDQGYSYSEIAKRLNIGRTTLYRKLKERELMKSKNNLKFEERSLKIY